MERTKFSPLGGDDIINLGEGGTPGASDPALADLALGGAGNDTFSAGGGLNVMYGGDGNDVFKGGNGENRMHGQNGDDELNSGAANDYLAGQVGNDTINAGGGNDYILPGFGDDVINGGTGNDFVAFNTRYADYQITTDGSTLFVFDTRNCRWNGHGRRCRIISVQRRRSTCCRQRNTTSYHPTDHRFEHQWEQYGGVFRKR